MDQGLATALAAAATVLVGVAVLIATLVTNSRAARATWAAQYAVERNAGLLELLEIAQRMSIHANDQVFNLTEARRDRSEDLDRLYGPDRRELVPVPPTDRARAHALLSVYGTFDMQKLYLTWMGTLRRLEELMQDAHFNYIESNQDAGAAFFAIDQLHETNPLQQLGRNISRAMEKVPS